MESNKEVNSWLIILLVLLTALLTSWAMLKYKPSQDWNGTAYYYPPQQFAENLSPGVAALREGWQNLQGGWQFAGGATASPVSNSGAAMVGPVINAGAVAPHADRGACTNCHMVVGSRQQQIPPIGSTAHGS